MKLGLTPEGAKVADSADIASVMPVRRRRMLPDGSLAWGVTAAMIGVLVVLPFAALMATSSGLGLSGIIAEVSEPVALAALGLSFGGSLLTAGINTVMGLLLAWVLVRYSFWGRGIADAAVDLPFALPTAVAGVTLAHQFGPTGWLGTLGTTLEGKLGLAAGSLAWLNLQASFTVWGVLIAMTFVTIPLVVRSVQPVLLALDTEVEEASLSLGASRLQTFAHVILPALRPALLAGFALSFARSLGEFGSVIVISGNIPFETLTGPVLIFQKLEQYDESGAAAVALVMLVGSLVTLAVVAFLQSRKAGSHG
ncbi:MAG: sulfate ABC transporter permease subunit CysT [Actinobacteria bacterium]|nr:sulfate ABC transporter permease subunit CysT [Actinomycetota bacterium]